jgi:hypothetical protein
MDCTFCLDCVHACPHDNVGILTRLPASELLTDPIRSGIGRFSRRGDLAALVTVFTFGALLNAFAMVSPIYALEVWLSKSVLHTNHEAPVLGVVFGAFLLLEPALLLGGAAWFTRVLRGSTQRLLPLAVRYSYALVPLGVGIWLAHYGFHFLTGLLTVVPLIQNLAATFGREFLGKPAWALTGLPVNVVQPLELGFLLLGLAGSLLVSYRLAEEDSPDSPARAFTPWAVVCVLLWAAAVWVMLQPMEMRGVFLGG